MSNTIDFITLEGSVLTSPAFTAGNLVEFVVADADERQFLIRIARSELGAHVTPGAHVAVAGAEGWVVPGRSWRDEPSRTIVQAHDVQLRELAFAA